MASVLMLLSLLLFVASTARAQRTAFKFEAQSVLDKVYNSDHELSAHGTEGGLYGETGVDAIHDSMAPLKPKPTDVFVDLGSGNGKINVAASLLFNFQKSVGFESSPTRHEQACRALDILKGNATHPGPMPSTFRGRLEFHKGDFTKEVWNEADIVFGGLLPDDELMAKLADKFRLMKNGARIVMLKKIKPSLLKDIHTLAQTDHKLGWTDAHPIFKYERKDGQVAVSDDDELFRDLFNKEGGKPGQNMSDIFTAKFDQILQNLQGNFTAISNSTLEIKEDKFQAILDGFRANVSGIEVKTPSTSLSQQILNDLTKNVSGTGASDPFQAILDSLKANVTKIQGGVAPPAAPPVEHTMYTPTPTPTLTPTPAPPVAPTATAAAATAAPPPPPIATAAPPPPPMAADGNAMVDPSKNSNGSAAFTQAQEGLASLQKLVGVRNGAMNLLAPLQELSLPFGGSAQGLVDPARLLGLPAEAMAESSLLEVSNGEQQEQQDGMAVQEQQFTTPLGNTVFVYAISNNNPEQVGMEQPVAAAAEEGVQVNAFIGAGALDRTIDLKHNAHCEASW